MVSFTARSVAFVMRKTGLFRRLPTDMPNFAKYQAKLLSKPSAPSAKNRKVCRVTQSKFHNRTVWTLAPRDKPPTAYVLYWHGGAYIYPATSAHWDFLAHMTSVHGWHITAPLYPLAPMTQVQKTTAFALEFMCDWMARTPPGIRVVAGDSAGGGLAAATLQTTRDFGLAMPEKAILICPWLEASPDHPDQARIEPHDAILTCRGIRAAGELYAGEAGAHDHRVSPLKGDWSRLPPLLVFGAGDDILVTDSRTLVATLPGTAYIEQAGMMHDWPILFFPESRTAQATMASHCSAVTPFAQNEA